MRRRGRQRCACMLGHGAVPYYVRNGRRVIVRHHHWVFTREADGAYRVSSPAPLYESLSGVGATEEEAILALLDVVPFRHEGHTCVAILPKELEGGSDEPATPLDLDALDAWAAGEGPAPWPEDG